MTVKMSIPVYLYIATGKNFKASIFSVHELHYKFNLREILLTVWVNSLPFGLF